MKKIMWLRIVITGLAVEFIYGLYISFLQWYEPNIFSSLIILGGLMVIGGFLVGRKSKSFQILQGALVGLTGAIFYVIVSSLVADNDQTSSGIQFWLEHCVKITGGALGGYWGMNHKSSRQLKSMTSSDPE